jgi:hypothetical protein
MPETEIYMKLYDVWRRMAEMQTTEQQSAQYWSEYFTAEKKNYQKILSDMGRTYSGTMEELAKEFDMEPAVFCGFMDGINTSLRKEYDVEALEETTEVTLDIDPEKLYYNMLEAKAKWLYTLPEWDKVLSEEKRKEITKEWRRSRQVINEVKIGRNDPCPCGSGKKYKNCHGKNA